MRLNVLPDARDATAALGQKLLVLEASTVEEIDAQFASLDQKPADAMLVPTTPFFVTRAGQIAALIASPQSTHGGILPKPAAS